MCDVVFFLFRLWRGCVRTDLAIISTVLSGSHGGGFLPSYAARMDHGCAVFPDQCKGPTLKKMPSEYLQQLYFDSLVFTTEALRHLINEHGASQIMIGTDYAVPWVKGTVEHVR